MPTSSAGPSKDSQEGSSSDPRTSTANTAPSENSPLLSSSDNHNAEINSSETLRLKSLRRILLLLLLYLTLLDLGYELIAPAQTQILEHIYCNDYYENHGFDSIRDGNGIDEKMCKIPVIQGKVAKLKGWQVAFDSFGMLLFSVPWAYIADSFGRKPVMLLLTAGLFMKYAYVQLICYFGGAVPLEWTWLSTIHTALGGSVTVATALVYTVVSDAFPESQRVSVFFKILAAAIATQFIGPLLSAALMSWSPWIPMLLGLAIEFLGFATLLILPETLKYKSSGVPIICAESTPIDGTRIDNKPWYATIRRSLTSTALLLSDIRILLIGATFLVHMLFLNRDILLQYVSTRYGISLAEATALVSIRSGVVLIMSLLVIPAVNAYVRDRLEPRKSDLLLSRISAGIFALSLLGVALAPKLGFLASALVLNSFGWGLWSFIRSLLTGLVEPHKFARVNTLVGVLDTIGLMAGSPLLARLFERGLELKGLCFGLPFLVCAGVVIVLAFLLARVRV